MMVDSRLLWLSGLALLLGGGLASAGWLLFAALDPGHINYAGRLWWPLNGLVIAGGVFMAMGLPGFYAAQARESGLPGLVGFVLLFVGVVLAYVGVQAIETATMPTIPAGMMDVVSVAAPSAFFGLLLTGFAIWQANVYPRWTAVALILAALLGLLAQFVPLPQWLGRSALSVTFTAPIAALGVILMSRN